MKMLCKLVPLPRKKKPGSVPVYLNVYDLTPMNGYAYWLGLGVYHSGVQGNQPTLLSSFANESNFGLHITTTVMVNLNLDF